MHYYIIYDILAKLLVQNGTPIFAMPILSNIQFDSRLDKGINQALDNIGLSLSVSKLLNKIIVYDLN